jgi:site-specific recombinase XerD
MSGNFQFDTRPEVDVIVYRHRADCRFVQKEKDGRCRCPKHLYVRLTRARISAKTKSWETARQRAKEWADNHDPVILREKAREAENAITPQLIEEAFDEFIASKQAASSNPDGYKATESKYGTMKKQLVDFLHVHDQGKPDPERVLYVHQITAPLLNQWMGTWKSKTYWSKSKKRDSTIAFFDYCIAQKWIKATLEKDRGNPARGIAKIVGKKDSSIPTLPFTPAQFKAVLQACAAYDRSLATVNKAEVRGKGRRLHALCNLMRWAGLAITDAVTLQRSRLGKDDRLVLYRTKTGNPVTVLLPPKIADELRWVPPGPDAHPDYLFWSGKGKKNRAASTWQKTLRRLWKLVKPALDLRDREGNRIRPKSHMFRNTFAVELLKKSVSVDHVAMLLADHPDTVKEHYYPWVPELQDLLEKEVKRSWDEDLPIILPDVDDALQRTVGQA